MGLAGCCGRGNGDCMETIHISEIEPHKAAQLLAGIEPHDPRGILTREDLIDIAQRGMCFLAKTEKGQAVYVINIKNDSAWISACKGSGPVNWKNLLFKIIEKQAAGCKEIGFQTARQGLKKEALKQGYEITGWILRKKLA